MAPNVDGVDEAELADEDDDPIEEFDLSAFEFKVAAVEAIADIYFNLSYY